MLDDLGVNARSSAMMLVLSIFVLTGCPGDTNDDEESQPGDTSMMDGSTDAVIADGGDTVQDDTASDTTSKDTETSDTGNHDGTIDVNGRVRGSAGEPIGNARVGILPDRTTTTDSSGNFAFQDVDPPYDLIVMTNEETADGTIYKDLEAQAPIAHLTTEFSPYSASLDGGMNGGFYDDSNPPEFGVTGGFVQTQEGAWPVFDDFASTRFTNIDESGNFQTAARWSNPGSISGRVFALQAESSTGTIPTGYEAYGTSSELTLDDGDSVQQVDVQLDQSVSEASLDATFNTPTDYEIVSGFVLASYEGRGGFFLTEFGSDSLQMAIPDAAPLETRVFVSATPQSGTRGPSVLSRTIETAEADSFEADIAAAPELVSPADGASNVDGTTNFSFNGFDNGVHVVSLQSSDPGTSELRIVTEDESTTIPDLTGVGFSLDDDSEYNLTVQALSPFANIDEAATPRFVALRSASGSPFTFRAVQLDFDVGFSGTRSITTAGGG